MILTSSIKQQCKMWCSLTMAFNPCHTRQTVGPTSEFHNQTYIYVKASEMFRGKPTRLSKFGKRRPLRKGQKIGDSSG